MISVKRISGLGVWRGGIGEKPVQYDSPSGLNLA
jgi:hypothetical protein